MKSKSWKMPEYVIYVIIWLIFLVFPIITNNYNVRGDTVKMLYDWLRMVPFLIVFLINNFWLLPKFLLKGNTNLYLSILFIITLSVTSAFQAVGPVLHKNNPKLLESI